MAGHAGWEPWDGRSAGRRDAGSTTLEAAIVVPALLLFLALMIVAGRVALARDTVNQAAWDAARAASLARTAGAAWADAATAAEAALRNHHLACDPAVAVDTSQFARPVGQAAEVTVTLTCAVAVADLSLPGVPGTLTVTVTAASPLDTYRERS
ncbi:MAG: pilus assembly protein [Propionibacteriaceae bacterium]|jgi:Flp pilus assembly protein TadG|nr:pilus assembly protein [Propionibacteriaceae bacterium]